LFVSFSDIPPIPGNSLNNNPNRNSLLLHHPTRPHPFTITLPINQLTPLTPNLDSAICNLSITTTSSDLNPASVSCTVYAPTSHPSLNNPLASILSPTHPIQNLHLGSALCIALPRNSLFHRALHLLNPDAPEKRHTETAKDKRAAEAAPNTGTIGGATSTSTGGESKPTEKLGPHPKKKMKMRKDEVGEEEKKRDAKPTDKEIMTPTGVAGSKPTDNVGDKKKGGKKREENEEEDEEEESREGVGKRGVVTYVDAAPGGLRSEMGIFGVVGLAIGIAAVLM
ncbi:hypothetical protein COCMIDRAFT_5605, partial [Bipolaris oryzae ATCC 44560]